MTLTDKEAKKTISNLYKHAELVELLNRINAIPTVHPKYTVNRSPKAKTNNVSILEDFLEDYGYYSHYEELTKENIDEFIRITAEQSATNDFDDDFDLDEFSKDLIHNEVAPNVNTINPAPMNTTALNNYNSTGFSPSQMNSAKKLKRVKKSAKKRITPQKAARTNFGGPSAKRGMSQLESIVLNLYRDVVRVKNAISPQGAAEIVEKHNEKARPEAHWQLYDDDVNEDGIPDIIIRNAKGDPMYINGYTTKRSDWPETLAYYQAYPKRKDRSGHSKADYLKNELYDIDYNDKTEVLSQRGLIGYTEPEWYTAASEKYKLMNFKHPKISPFRRFQRYIVMPLLEDFLQRTYPDYKEGKISIPFKGPLLAKVSGEAWREAILKPAIEHYKVSPEDIDSFKKSSEFRDGADNEVTRLIDLMENRSDEEEYSGFTESFDQSVLKALDELGVE